MNHNRKVITFIVVVTSIHLILSLFSDSFIGYFPTFKNVNLISDIVLKPVDVKQIEKNDIEVVEEPLPYNSPINTFDAYLKKGTLISFDQDTINPALKKFTDKLIALSENKKVKIRIAWFGDSQIEGDFITQDLRELLQNYFGQEKGVGFIPISSVSDDFRHSAKIVTIGDVTKDNLKKQSTNSNLFLSGYSFFSDDLSIEFKDNVKRNTNQISQKWLLYGKGDSIAIKINDSIRKFPADKEFNRVLVGSGSSNKARFQVSSNKTPLYGISSEPESGIILDNFSFRGITGVELKKIDSKMLQELNNSGYYDLIVFQYGVNLMFKPDNTNYDDYYRGMKNVLKKFKNNMPDTEFLMLSCSDRAFNYNGEWKTAIGIDSLINTQAKLAYNNKLAFYNFYQSIGGKGTMVKWADSTVKLANKDYVHFNFRGAKAVAKIIYKALINDYNKALKIKNTNSQTKQISNTIVKKDV
jgi:lysophospholipase L1-like esterase